jgi:23S rRNA (adenine2503-C2)-methyltransferase
MTEAETTIKTDIRLLSRTDLEAALSELGEPRFRSKQILEWLWNKGAISFDEMSNLPKSLRATLEAHFCIRSIVEDKVQHSSDGTIKTRFRLHDGHLIESVLIPVPEEQRFTVCVSSQVGCSLTCSFCATGRMKRVRNLDAGEIFDQVVMVNRQSLETFGYPLTNIVYMGMGEPLLAYKPMMESIERITSPEGAGHVAAPHHSEHSGHR